MVERIEAAQTIGAIRFVIVGDSGAWPDPTAEAIFAALVDGIAALDPPPAFVAQLGDFAGPGTAERHGRYLELVEPLDVPNICIVGNHDLDDAAGLETFERIHGQVNFDFAVGHTRFVALHSEPGAVGRVAVDEPPEGTEGPRDADSRLPRRRALGRGRAEPRRAHAHASALRRPPRATRELGIPPTGG